jgi:hypothetical protein
MRIFNQIFLIVLTVTGMSIPAAGQFPPQAGIAGSTAIPAADPRFVAWATGCTVSRGYLDIAQPSAGRALSGTDDLGTGSPDFQVVSLGDSGVAVLTFAAPIINGPGPDFAVFENGFTDPSDPEAAYLELAFVEVSSDGIHYTRFPAISHIQDTVQTSGAGEFLNARLIHNLAGKYRSGYGTPFDLEELADTPGLDVNHITHIRLVDVVGSIGEHGSKDHEGRVINDPYPTAYAIGTGGFDLDAVGVIHQQGTGVAIAGRQSSFHVYPNPAADYLYIGTTDGTRTAVSIRITDLAGKVLLAQRVEDGQTMIPMAHYIPGMYCLFITDSTGTTWVERISKH